MPRGNTGNLIPSNQRSKEEHREIARNGGIKSGEARRAKRDAKQRIELLAKLPIHGMFTLDAKGNKILLAKAMEKAGIDPTDANMDLGMDYALMMMATRDINARKYFDELRGENPSLKLKEKEFDHKIKSGDVSESVIEAMEKYIAAAKQAAQKVVTEPEPEGESVNETDL